MKFKLPVGGDKSLSESLSHSENWFKCLIHSATKPQNHWFVQTCWFIQEWNKMCFQIQRREETKKERRVAKYGVPYLGICALHLTHPSAHTHTVNTHPEQWAANAAAPGEQLGVRCLAQGHLSRGIEGGESSWGFGALLKGTSVVVLKVERAVGGSVSCSRAPQSWYWRWREQLGVRCLAQGSHLSRGIEGGESAGYSLPPPTIPAGPETRTREYRVTSLNIYPVGHDCR